MTRLPFRRRGYTLIEVLTAIVIAGVMLGALTTLMGRVVQSHAAAEQHLRGVASLGRLGEQFRRDAHAALRAAVARPDDAPGSLLLTLPDQSEITYTIEPGCVLRARKLQDMTVAREAFALGTLQALGFEHHRNGARDVALVIGRTAGGPSDDGTVTGRFEITAFLPPGDREEDAP